MTTNFICATTLENAVVEAAAAVDRRLAKWRLTSVATRFLSATKPLLSVIVSGHDVGFIV